MHNSHSTTSYIPDLLTCGMNVSPMITVAINKMQLPKIAANVVTWSPSVTETIICVVNNTLITYTANPMYFESLSPLTLTFLMPKARNSEATWRMAL